MASARDIEDLNRCLHEILIFKLRIVRLDLWSEKLAGVHHIDLGLLTFIETRPQHTLGDIREFLQVPQSTLTSMINRLEKRGLVRRAIHPSDKRSYMIELTPQGEEVQREHHRIERVIARRLLDALPSDADRTQLIELFRRIIQKL